MHLEICKKHFESMREFRVAQDRATLANEFPQVHGWMRGRLRADQQEFAALQNQKDKILRDLAESIFEK